MNEHRSACRKDTRIHKMIFCAAVLILLFAVLTAAFLYHRHDGYLVLSSEKTGKILARYPVRLSDIFSIGFVHSVNKTPVTDYYEIREDGIYVVKTVYYGFDADGSDSYHSVFAVFYVLNTDHTDPLVLLVML